MDAALSIFVVLLIRSVLSPSFDGHTTTLPVDASPCLRCWWKRQIEETPRECPQ